MSTQKLTLEEQEMTHYWLLHLLMQAQHLFLPNPPWGLTLDCPQDLQMLQYEPRVVVRYDSSRSTNIIRLD